MPDYISASEDCDTPLSWHGHLHVSPGRSLAKSDRPAHRLREIFFGRQLRVIFHYFQRGRDISRIHKSNFSHLLLLIRVSNSFWFRNFFTEKQAHCAYSSTKFSKGQRPNEIIFRCAGHNTVEPIKSRYRLLVK